MGGNNALLEAYDLGFDRLCREVSKGLESKKTIVTKTGAKHEVDDTKSINEMRKLLADINGARKLGVEHGGKVERETKHVFDFSGASDDDIRELRDVLGKFIGKAKS